MVDKKEVKKEVKKGAFKASEPTEKDYSVLIKPLITEKGTLVSQAGQVIFEVAVDSTKTEIKNAIQNIYGVEVKSVNTIVSKGKSKVFGGFKGKRKNTKKAYATIIDGMGVDVIENIK